MDPTGKIGCGLVDSWINVNFHLLSPAFFGEDTGLASIARIHLVTAVSPAVNHHRPVIFLIDPDKLPD